LAVSGQEWVVNEEIANQKATADKALLQKLLQ
jgi:hypothetical protein